MLEAREITVAYRRRVAVAAASLTVRRGEIVALCGPNGCGKSSLIGALAGDIRPRSGAALIGGEDVAGLTAPDLARRRAALEQTPTLSAPFTTRALAALAIPRRVPPAEAEAITAHALHAVGLADRADDRVGALSGGQQRRAHLARALAQLQAGRNLGGGFALILDEPTAGLDAAHQIGVLAAASDAADQGAAVLVALHDLSLAAAFADRICLMRAGRIEADAPPEAALDAARLSEIYETEMSVHRNPSGALSAVPVLPHPIRKAHQQGAYPCSSP